LPADDDAIRRLNDTAFGGPAESKLIADLRGWLGRNAFMALEFVPGALDGAEVSVVYPPAFGVTPPLAASPAG
jgi:predicted N-acetyltransferase YhbS